MSEEEAGERPEAPTPAGATMLTLLAWAVGMFAWATLLPWVGHWGAFGVALALGYGVVGTLAARGLPTPAEPRLGLRGFERSQALWIALAVPAVLLLSEVDNVIRPLVPALTEPTPGAEPAEDVIALLAIEFTITTVLLRPVLEEFFFRGVIQQGLVVWMGASAGVALTSVLFVLAVAGFAFPLGPQYAASLAAQAAFIGPVLGLFRLATGSLLAPILLQMTMAAFGVLAMSYPDTIPIEGFNTPGDHTPFAILAPAALSVLASIVLANRELKKFR